MKALHQKGGARCRLFRSRRQGLSRKDATGPCSCLSPRCGRRWRSFEIAPKSQAGVRRALLCETLRLKLLEHVERTGKSGDDLIFGRKRGLSFRPDLAQAAADAVWTKAGLKRVSPHECRHGYQSFADSIDGISDARKRAYLGHAPDSTTASYTHSHRLPGRMASDAALLDAYWNAEPATVIELRPTGATGAITGAQQVPDQRSASAEAVRG